MSGSRRPGFVSLLVGALVAGALLLGPLAPPAAAGTVTTECTLMAKSSPSTVGGPATFRFFAAARFPTETGPSPVGLVSFFDGATFLGTEFLPLEPFKDNSDVSFTTTRPVRR